MKTLQYAVLAGLVASGIGVAHAESYYKTSSKYFSNSGNAQTTHSFTLPSGKNATSAGYLKVELTGDFDSSNEYAKVYIDGSYRGRAYGNGAKCQTSLTKNFHFTAAQAKQWFSDGKVSVVIKNSAYVTGCANTQKKHGLALKVNEIESTVVAKTLSKIGFSGCSSYMNEGTTNTCKVIAIFSDGSRQDVTSSATITDNSRYASINSRKQVVTSQVASDQRFTLTASYSYNGSSPKNTYQAITIKDTTVAATVKSLSTNCLSSLDEKKIGNCSATVVLSDNTSANVTRSVAWSVSPAYATINSNGTMVAKEVTGNKTVTVKAIYTLRGVPTTKTRTVTIRDTTAAVVPPPVVVTPVISPPTEKQVLLSFTNKSNSKKLTLNSNDKWVSKLSGIGVTLCEKSRPTYCLNTIYGNLRSSVVPSRYIKYAQWKAISRGEHVNLKNIARSNYYMYQSGGNTYVGRASPTWYGALWKMAEVIPNQFGGGGSNNCLSTDSSGQQCSGKYSFETECKEDEIRLPRKKVNNVWVGGNPAIIKDIKSDSSGNVISSRNVGEVSLWWSDKCQTNWVTVKAYDETYNEISASLLFNSKDKTLKEKDTITKKGYLSWYNDRTRFVNDVEVNEFKNNSLDGKFIYFDKISTPMRYAPGNCTIKGYGHIAMKAKGDGSPEIAGSAVLYENPSCSQSFENGNTTNLSNVSDDRYLPETLSYPFNKGENWMVCQGYNTKELTHHKPDEQTGKYGINVGSDLSLSLDLSILGSNDNNPARFNDGLCYGYLQSKGKEVIAPASGKINRHPDPDTICIDFYNDKLGSMLLGHFQIGRKAPSTLYYKAGDEVLKGKPIGTLGGGGSTPTVTGKEVAHIHMGLYKDHSCTQPIPFGTSFYDGGNYTNDGKKWKWRGTQLNH